MKKSISYSVLVMLTVTLFASCVSITKRHYNKGYHIERIHHFPSGTAADNDEKRPENKKNNTSPQPLQPTQVAEDHTPTEPISSVATPATQTTSTASSSQPVTFQSKNKPGRSRSAFTPKPYIKKLIPHKMKKPARTQQSEALSLMWILIVAIFILWVIGFATEGYGIGGLINILLVVVLVLLILWLLRII